jgi:rhodanese-related sulfurtransferase
MPSVDKAILARLDPISSLSSRRLAELADLCFVETVSKDLDPFRMNMVKASQALYLLKGELGLRFENGDKQVLRGGSEEARQPVARESAGLKYALALTDLEIVRIDIDLLDIMMTWDQLAGYEKSATKEAAQQAPVDAGRGTAKWMQETGVFSVGKLMNGVFSKLPPANVEEMFRRMSSVPVKADQTIIVQGSEGDYYYLIESGTAEVSRIVEADQPPKVLAELHEGDAFGEDALVSDNKRNATVTMKTDGVLLRLKKSDFIELLQAPLLSRISFAEAEAKIASGACPLWLDVRFPSEYSFDHLPDSINVPLHEIRNYMQKLDATKEYIAYCQTGRRSSAAAFIMAQHGFKVFVLEGGTKSARSA